MKRAFGVVDPETTITSLQMEHHLDTCDPLACVLFSHSPSVQVYYALRSRLESSPEAWLQEFVALYGLDSLLDSLGHMTGPKFSGFSDAILQIDCLSCIRTVLNSRVGMDTLINSQDGVKELLRGIDLANALPRKHVLELLSAVCVYNKLAYRRLMDAMNKHRGENHMYHRFSFIVNELKLAETIPHKTAVLTLINAIISSTTDRTKRCRIRNEFVGLSLLDVLSFLQREDTDEDLYIQLQVFQNKKHEDETVIDLDSSLDLSSPQDLADAIQSRVFGGPKMVSFVNILQDLLAIEYLEKEKCDTLWQLLERHVHHIVHGMDDIDNLSSMETESLCQAVTLAIGHDLEVPTIGTRTSHTAPTETRGKNKKFVRQNSAPCIRKDGVAMKTSADSGYLGYEDKLSPPNNTKEGRNTSNSDNCSPCNTKGFGCQSHEGHSDEISEQCHCQKKTRYVYGNQTDKSNTTGNYADIYKAMNSRGRQVSIYDNMSPVKDRVKQEVDKSHGRDRGLGLNMNDLTTQELKQNSKALLTTATNITERSNLILKIGDLKDAHWKMGNGDYAGSGLPPPHPQHNYLNYQRNRLAFPANKMRNLKWIKLDESTVERFPHSLWANADACRLKIQPDFQQVEEMFREKYLCDESTETPLLSHKTRLSLNLFVNRLDEEPIELVKRLARVDGPGLPLPFIKHLMEILPEYDEIKHLKYYNGNLLDLGQAEQFVLHLSDLPNYSTLLTGQLRRAEFSVKAPHLQSVLASMLVTSRLILSSDGLQEMFMLILRLGNFLNHSQFNGYANGYKLSSLTRLTEVKSREPGHNFVHFLVSLADSTDDRILTFLSEIPCLEKAASCSPADIKADFDKLNVQINSFIKELSTANPIVREGFNGFLEEVKQKFRELQNEITELKLQSQRLAEYFCESDSFEIENCFRILLGFFKQLRICRQEAQLMKKQKNIATRHSSMYAQQIRSKNIALKFGQEAGASSSMMEEKKQVVEHLLTELHRGNFSPSITPPAPHPAPPVSRPGTDTDRGPSPVTVSVPSSETSTPHREPNLMELSHISLMGTPMMNRPSSEMYDEELTITAFNSRGPKMVTSSVSHLPENTAPPTVGLMKAPPPVLAIQSPLGSSGPRRSRSHHRSRSDLAESINVTKKWIRYHQQARQECVQAPLARPESSMTLATLNLETKMRHNPHDQLVALVVGPTIELPTNEDASDTDPHMQNYEFVRSGKRGERKSGALSNFFNKISKKVLRQRSNSDHNSGGKGGSGSSGDWVSGGETTSGESDGKHEKGYVRSDKVHSKGGSIGRASGMPMTGNDHRNRGDDKENMIDQVNPFDRQKKNPIRLSNRFKGKSTK